MIELQADVLISTLLGGYVVELRIGDTQIFHSASSLSQVWRLAKAHLEMLEETPEDAPVGLIEDE